MATCTGRWCASAITLPGIALLIVLISVASSGPTDVGVIVAGFLLAVTQGATTIVASIYRARGDAGRFALVNTVLAAIGRAAVAVVVYVTGASAAAVLWTFVALNVGVIALTWRRGNARPAGRRTSSHRTGRDAARWGGVEPDGQPRPRHRRRAARAPSAAGMYGAALRVAEVSIQFLIALSVIYLPEATRLAVAHRTEALRPLYRTTSRWATLVSVLAAGAGFVAAPELARIVFPSASGHETTLMRILFVGYAIHGALGQTYGTLLALGAYSDIWRSSIVSLPIIVAGTIGLTAAFGTEGAAWSTCLAYALTGVWWAWQVRRRSGRRAVRRVLLACTGRRGASLRSRHSSPASATGFCVGSAPPTIIAAVGGLGARLRLVGGLGPSERQPWRGGCWLARPGEATLSDCANAPFGRTPDTPAAALGLALRSNSSRYPPAARKRRARLPRRIPCERTMATASACGSFRGDQDPGRRVHHLPQPVHGGGDHRKSHHHRLERRQRERVGARRHHQHVPLGQLREHIVTYVVDNPARASARAGSPPPSSVRPRRGGHRSCGIRASGSVARGPSAAARNRSLPFRRQIGA